MSSRLLNTAIAIEELNNYLQRNNYFEDQDTEATNERIKNNWSSKFEDAIVEDIKSRFENIEVDITLSEFKLISADHQGACVFLQKLVITDTVKKDSISIIFKSLINLPRTQVYLDSEYANILKWKGESKPLKTIFKRLKQADKNFGYFDPISIDELIKPRSIFDLLT